MPRSTRSLPTPEHHRVCIESPIAASYLDIHESAIGRTTLEYNGAIYKRDGTMKDAEKTPRYVFERAVTEED